MLVQARRAKTANTFAPFQEKRSVASARIRWAFGPSIALWMHAAADTTPAGSTISAMNDRSGAAVSIAQGTAARQPLKTTLSNVAPALQFDGVNDWLTLGSIDIAGLQTITLATVEQQTNSAFAYQIDVNTANPRAFLARYNNVVARNISLVSIGNAGISNIWSTGAYNSPVCIIGTVDWSQPSGSEVAIYADGSAPATLNGAVNNTNSFAASVGAIGAIATGAGTGPYGGYICSALVLKRALSAAEAAALSTLMRQASGVA